MQVVFRVDASNCIGTGHVMRCLTLANTLQEKGAECIFVHRQHRGNMAEAVRQRGFSVRELPAPESTSELAADVDYAAWLGVSKENDARETIAALRKRRYDWLIVDHYSLDAEWEELIRPHVDNIAVIDDLANRYHDCDLLLDQNYVPEAEQRYSGLVPDHCRSFCSPRYALLRPEYSQARSLVGPRRGPLRRVLVFYGGADIYNETARALRVLSRDEFVHLAIDVVIGLNNVHREALLEQADRRDEITVHGPREHLVDLMIQADLAIGAGGTTTWERCALGLPSIVTAVAENQEVYNSALAMDGLINYLGRGSQVTDEVLAEALRSFSEDSQLLTDQATRAWWVTDGLGAVRVAEAIQASDRGALTLRPARREDKALHCEWKWHQGEPSTLSWVLVTPSGLPVGQVRVDLEESDAVLDYRIDYSFRERGWGACLLEIAINAWRSEGAEAELTKNDCTEEGTLRRAFLRARIAKDGTLNEKDNLLSITVLSDSDSWINEWIPVLLAGWLSDGHRIRWVHNPVEFKAGDLCFFLGYSKRVPQERLSWHRNNLVVHESDLPKGRGWSPLTWQVLGGASHIPITLLEATFEVDSGPIYLQEWIELEGWELIAELRAKQGTATLAICRKFVADYPRVLGDACPQVGDPTWYPRRTPKDSELDCRKGIAEQFQLLRVVDNDRYPAYFELGDCRFQIKIEHMNNE